MEYFGTDLFHCTVLELSEIYIDEAQKSVD